MENPNQIIPRPARVIRRLRLASGLNQTKFAAKLGVAQQTLSSWETGKNLGPVKLALRLARFLHTS